ncbi:heterokaryon incompatibility protein-domain-containing protein [Podospora fimiseda]|uniref:Heterokaryon incompatibility protein-domain-containing protein n=1 Tax=Podospora fimiseda TaxID=252190 RepID=A0AAN6YQD5_9PEZI|nr:heterokaryon incompatibility protein-domain-containing protein [Podospora fimiseda]
MTKTKRKQRLLNQKVRTSKKNQSNITESDDDNVPTKPVAKTSSDEFMPYPRYPRYDTSGDPLSMDSLIFERLVSETQFTSIFPQFPPDWTPAFTRRLNYSKQSRFLCKECARYDWYYHLIGFGLLPNKEANFHPDNFDMTDNYIDGTKLRSHLGGEYELSSRGTFISFSSMANATANQQTCTLCSLVVAAVRATVSQERFEAIGKDTIPIKVSCLSPFQNNRPDHWIIHMRLCPPETVKLFFSLYRHPYLHHLTTNPLTKLAIRAVGRAAIPSTGIELDSTILSWWKTCKDTHVKSRNRGSRTPPFLDDPTVVFRVIDVLENKVIIPPNKKCAYVALSYVWGGIYAHQSTKAKKKKDILTDDEFVPINRKKLPRTIRNAIELTELLGERYLWVDSLCIIQDDDAEKAGMISIMDRVYQHALLTIVAADGKDAHAGLVGLQPGSRSFRSITGSIDDIDIILSEPQPTPKDWKWSSRAWTYQEEQFSQRMLIFAHERVYYYCNNDNKSSYGEARPTIPLDKPLLPRTRLEFRNSAIFSEQDQVLYAYTVHVEAYTTRNLTNESDIIHAFEGVMSHLSSIHKNDYIFFWGLPGPDIIYALAWKPISGPEHGSQIPLRRREARTKYLNGAAYLFQKKRPMPDTKTPIQFPSWSWTGWVGPVKYDVFEHPFIYCWKERTSEETCYFSSPVILPELWNEEEKPQWQKAVMDMWTKGLIKIETEVASIEYENVKEYAEHQSDNDPCGLCRGQDLCFPRVIKMDDGTEWTSGTKEGFLLLEGNGFVEDFRSHFVVLFRRDEETGVCYREGIVELQRREWEAGSPRKETLVLG